MLVADTLVPPTFVDKNGWVDVSQWTGRSLNTIPRVFRDADDDRLTHVDSIMRRAVEQVGQVVVQSGLPVAIPPGKAQVERGFQQ